MSDFDMSDKRYVITGASSGIGRSAAIRLADAGAKVILLGRNKERLKKVALTLSGAGHEYYIVDLSQEQDFVPLFDTITKDFKLDGIIYSAGIGPIIPLKLMKRAVIDEVMTTNLYSFLELVRLFANKKYSKPESSVVAISSIAAVQPEKCQTVYSMSKAALNVAVQTLAYELAPKQIRINSIMPGMCNTDMVRVTADSVNGDYLKGTLERQLLGILEPESIADICLFLLSDMSKAITGRAIYADGGRL